MNQEKFKLHWHTYTDHLKEMLHDMMSSNELTDVTLVSDDKVHFKAHKVVLSACSPTFKSIVSDNHLTNQSIFLRGIQSHEVESILHFIYLGQATFYQDRMNEFLNVAKSLEIKEISKENQENEEAKKEKIEEAYQLPIADAEPKNLKELIIKQKSSKTKLNVDAPHDSVKSCNPENETKKVKIEEAYELPILDAESMNLKELVIKQKSSIPKLNVDAPHYSGKSCNQCAKHFYDKSTLKKHVRTIHEGAKYPCDQCNHKATRLYSLQQHIKSVHQGVRYQCDQCNHKVMRLDSLQLHIKSFHEGVKYPCDQCDDKFSRQSSLYRHIKSAHEATLK